jgi:SAM-dependent methyltransferase
MTANGIMGTAEVQGELWGAHARDWANVQEPTWKGVYEEVFTQAEVTPGTKLLDIGCGAGGALVVASGLGAEVSGLDASQSLVAVARERLPSARIEVGEMEELPFEDDAFDVVTGFNSFQFAGDIVRALGEARRVCRPGGHVAVLIWGRREDCELVSAVLPGLIALLPPVAPSAPAPFDFGSPGVMEGLMQTAGLDVFGRGELDASFEYPDAATAIRAISSAGPSTRATRHAGEQAVTDALAAALLRFSRRNGSIALRNRFRWVMATPA